jgi:hypothetical protein
MRHAAVNGDAPLDGGEGVVAATDGGQATRKVGQRLRQCSQSEWPR